MRLFEAFTQKWTLRHERDAPQVKITASHAPPGTVAPELSGNEHSIRLATLTPRERDIFLLLVEGYTLKECAKQLSVKYSTANTHMTGLYKKLNVNSRAELIIRYRDAARKSD